MVLAERAAGDGGADRCRRLVSPHPRRHAEARPRTHVIDTMRHTPRQVGISISHPGRAAVLEVLLRREPEHLLHVLSDRAASTCPCRTPSSTCFCSSAAFAIGVLVGGPIGDRVGRKYVIWVRSSGVLPFTLALPYANLFWTGVLTVIIGLVLASASSAIIVYAQELLPGRVGMISGLVLRPRLRAWRPRRRGARLAGRRHEPRFRLRGVRVPARHRTARRLPSRPQTTTSVTRRRRSRRVKRPARAQAQGPATAHPRAPC